MPKIKFEIDGGRLGKEPEIKYTKDNTTIARLSIAVNEYFKNKKGEWEQKGETSWVNGAAFGYPAECIESMDLKKGDRVFIQGTMKTSVWEDDEGEERKDWDFYINKLFKVPDVDFDEDDEDEKPKRRSGKKSGKRTGKSKGKFDLGSLGSKTKKKGKSNKNLAAQILGQLKK